MKIILGDNIRNSNNSQMYMSAALNKAPVTNLITERANGLNGNLTAHRMEKNQTENPLSDPCTEYNHCTISLLF